jgi:hypothetical protein
VVELLSDVFVKESVICSPSTHNRTCVMIHRWLSHPEVSSPDIDAACIINVGARDWRLSHQDIPMSLFNLRLKHIGRHQGTQTSRLLHFLLIDDRDWVFFDRCDIRKAHYYNCSLI